MLYAAEYTWRLKTPNTEPDICDLWHAKSSYFRSTDTLRLQWPFPLQTGRRCFPLAVEYLNPIRIDHVTLWWATDNSCAHARESICPWSCSKPYMDFVWWMFTKMVAKMVVPCQFSLSLVVTTKVFSVHYSPFSLPWVTAGQSETFC